MKSVAKLIHRTYASYLPTAFPAHYYGMPNGKIYLVFSRFYEIAFGETGLEFVFAEHADFSYDYDNDKIMRLDISKQKVPVFVEDVDYPGTKINILSVHRNLNSYGEAQRFLNTEAWKMQQLT